MGTAVCHLVYNRFPQDPRVRREALSLMRYGYEVHVLCIRNGDEPKEESWEGIRVHRVPLRMVRGGKGQYIFQYSVLCLMFAARLLQMMVRHRFAIVHVHSVPDALIFIALPARIFGAKLVLDLHESLPELYRARFPQVQYGLSIRVTLLAQRLSCMAADRIMTVNEYLRSLLVRRGIPDTNIVVLANSPDWMVDGTPAEVSPAIRSDVPEVVIVGGLNPERDYPLILRAAKIAYQQVPFSLRIIGYGDPQYRAHLVRLSEQLGIEAWARVESEVPPEAVRPLLERTAFGIVSYERNPLTEIATPNKVYEYALVGKAMIVSALPALLDLLGNAALFFEPGDVEGLARHMIYLLRNPEERDRLGALASEVHRINRWPAMEERLMSLYSSLMP